MNRLACFVLFLVGSATAEVPIRLPDTAPPPPAPTPEIIPPPVQRLTADVLYVIDADVELFVLSSPTGLVKVTPEQGPLKVRGLFVGNTNVSTRNYKGKYVYFVEPIGTGRVELLVVPVGVTNESSIVRRTVDVDSGTAPRPPPTPMPTPVPGGMRVLIVYETADSGKLPSSQLAVLHGQTVRDYLNQKCVRGPDGKTAEWRLWDAHVPVESESAVWKTLMARPRASLPWITITTDTTSFDGPLPLTITDTMNLLRRFGG